MFMFSLRWLGALESGKVPGQFETLYGACKIPTPDLPEKREGKVVALFCVCLVCFRDLRITVE